MGLYLCKIVLKMQMHGQCVPRRCFKGTFGKYLPYCKYGFLSRCHSSLRNWTRTACTLCMCIESMRIGWWFPTILRLPFCGSSHKVQRVSKHGFKQYLAKYISKAELSSKIQLPENASLPERYLRTRGVGVIEAVELLSSFHQSQISRQVIFLHTELDPSQCMHKYSRDLQHLQPDSQDVCASTHFETY